MIEINFSDVESISQESYIDNGHDMALYDLSGLDDIDPEENRCGRFYDPSGVEHDIAYDDKRTFTLFNEQMTDTIFQFDTGLAKRILSDASVGSGISNFEMLTLLNAMGHPGPIAMIPNALENRDSNTDDWRKKLKAIHPILYETLKDTYGIIVFQEQLTTLWQRIAGFSATEAQLARKDIAKKRVDKINKIRDRWIVGASKQMDPQIAATYFDDVMAPFGRYAFNRCLSKNTLIKCVVTGVIKTIEEWYSSDSQPFLNAYNGVDVIVDKCIDIHNNGELEVFEIEFDNGKKELVTMNHKFLCSDGLYHEVRDIIEKGLDVAEVDAAGCKLSTKTTTSSES